jgi:Na+/H+ antiporter NhaC
MTDHARKLRRAYGLIFFTFAVSFYFLPGTPVETSWSLLPPAMAIFLAFLTSSLSISLGAAVLLGGFLMAVGQGAGAWGGLSTAVQQAFLYAGSALIGEVSVGHLVAMQGMEAWKSLSWTNLQILGFVFFILSMVHVMTASGGLLAMVRSLQKFIVGPRSAQFVTALLGCLIFIDDYANTMIVGSTMRKVTDRYKVSREKLAFLVDATSAPIAGVALVSTWIGYEVGLFSEMAQKFEWGIDGYAVFLDAIPFRFYCFLMLFFVFVNILFGVDFGKMKDYQKSPIIDDDPFEDNFEPRASVWCAIGPIGLLLVLVFTLMWRDGGGFSDQRDVLSLTDWQQVLTSSQNGIWILFVSSMICYLVAFIFGWLFSDQGLSTLLATLGPGLRSSWLPISILVLAWSLKEVCSDLNTGEYLVTVLSDRVSQGLLPLAIFLVSAVTAFATGTSWGTMAILIPTVTPLAMAVGNGSYGVYVAMCLAAILDGAIMGDHCSPISDTTIMSSISSDCRLMNHVRSQLPYTLFVGSLAVIFGYWPAGQWGGARGSLLLALFVIVGLFMVLKLKPRFTRGVYE